jgi:hypothetical protein
VLLIHRAYEGGTTRSWSTEIKRGGEMPGKTAVTQADDSKVHTHTAPEEGVGAAIKGGKEMYYPGAPHGLTATHQNLRMPTFWPYSGAAWARGRKRSRNGGIACEC